MGVLVKRGDVPYICKSEEQLKLFLDAGYVIVDEPKEETSKAQKKSRKAE